MEQGKNDDPRMDPTAGAVARLRSHYSGRDAGYFIKTFGCQMNAHDSERLAGLLEAMGLTERAAPEDADIILVNTCCVREHAQVKVYGAVGAYCKMKRMKRSLIIGVCGCMTQQEGMAQNMRSRFPGVNFYLGTQSPQALPGVLLRAVESGHAVNGVSPPDAPDAEGIPTVRRNLISAYVNIMYGCDNYCSYCVVPFVRGRERSREPEAVLGEIADLVRQGCLEVTLLGQNVNSYGRGLAEPVSFARLLHMADAVPGIRRIRFMTSHPKDLSEELMDAMASCAHVCPQLHLPVQSGSDRVLAAMNRGYTRTHYLGLVGRLREKIPDIGLTTDVIAGFPGETEEDFGETLSLLREVRYDSAFLFSYSVRIGTAAETLTGGIEEPIKRRRLKRLIGVQEAISAELNAARVGRSEEVLAESVSARDPGELSGRTPQGRTVSFAGGADLLGRIVTVRITRAKAHTLSGEIETQR